MRKLISGIVEFRERLLPRYAERFRDLALAQTPDALFITCWGQPRVPDLLASTHPGESLVRMALAEHPAEKTISHLAISVSNLEKDSELQMELSFGLEDERRRPGTKRGMARRAADCAADKIRNRFGWESVGYGSVMLGTSRSVPDEFRVLAEKEL